MIVAINKIDKSIKSKYDTIMDELNKNNISNIIEMSVLNDIGIDKLKNKIEEIFETSDLDYENELIITNERHKSLLKEAADYLNEAKSQILNGAPIDIVEIVIKSATKSLGQIIGTDVSQDVVDKIFEKFCLGK